METITGTELDATIFLLFMRWTKELDDSGRFTGGDEELVEFYSQVMGQSPDGAGALSYRAFIGGIKTGLQHAQTIRKATKTEEKGEIDLSWITSEKLKGA